MEGDRIEYKTGWNPDAIYRSVCAFANDFDETGGGYIVVGVKEVNGRPVRPVVGIDPNRIAPIETGEERTYFLIDIPCHLEFVKDRVVLNKDFIKDFIKENRAQVSERQEEILSMIADDESLTSQKIAQKTGVSQRTILKDLTQLQALGILARVLFSLKFIRW